MLKIGDFARLAHVTVKTLRHYGRMGLLEPAWIDRYTGYRYYNLSQLSRLNLILALKDLGFSLEQVAEMLDEDVPASQLRAMLTLKKAELHQRLQSEQNRLAQVEARLKQIEREGALPVYEVLIKSTQPQMVAAIRQVLSEPEQVPPHAARLCRELTAWLLAAGVRPTGPWQALYQARDEGEGEVEVELAVGIDAELRRPPNLI